MNRNRGCDDSRSGCILYHTAQRSAGTLTEGRAGRKEYREMDRQDFHAFQ
jgi:hypothetical protein